MAPAADRPQVDVRPKETGSPRDQEGPLRPDRPDGYGESGVGLHSDPGAAEESGPRRGPEYGRQGAQGPRDPARARPSVLLADVPTGPLGRDRGGRLFHQ